MSWLSSIGDAIGNVAKKVGSVVKNVATPLASFAVGLIPGVGPLLSKGVDIVGNKLLGEDGDASSSAGSASATPVSDLLAQLNGTTATQLGASPAASALAAATTDEATSTASGFLGIGDGKPGVLGIGTGKNKARKAAEAEATAAGKSPAVVKAAGEAAAAEVKGASGEASINWGLLIGGAVAALLVL